MRAPRCSSPISRGSMRAACWMPSRRTTSPRSARRPRCGACSSRRTWRRGRHRCAKSVRRASRSIRRSSSTCRRSGTSRCARPTARPKPRVQIGCFPGERVEPGSMGQEAPGYRIRLLDADDKDVEEGEVCIDLDPAPVGLMRGYQNDDGSFAPLGTNAYRTGDVAARSTDGYYTYIGRADDVFKASDYRISPFELESALIEHPAVAEAAVVPAPDPIRLAVPKAYITLTAKQRAGSRDRAVDLPASARDARAVQARAAAGVHRSAEDDIRQDPSCGVAPAGGGAGEAGSARCRGVPRGGFPGAERAMTAWIVP